MPLPAPAAKFGPSQKDRIFFAGAARWRNRHAHPCAGRDAEGGARPRRHAHPARASAHHAVPSGRTGASCRKRSSRSQPSRPPRSRPRRSMSPAAASRASAIAPASFPSSSWRNRAPRRCTSFSKTLGAALKKNGLGGRDAGRFQAACHAAPRRYAHQAARRRADRVDRARFRADPQPARPDQTRPSRPLAAPRLGLAAGLSTPLPAGANRCGPCAPASCGRSVRGAAWRCPSDAPGIASLTSASV